MNLTKMFKIQKELDERIVKEKSLKGVDLLDKKILSLQVELGELANELPEVFKFWSNKKNNYKKALEEYCDCLHFILSIGNEIDIKQWDYDYTFMDDLMELDNITEQFIMIMGGARKLFYDIAYRDEMKGDEKVSEFELEFRVWKSYRLIIGPFLSLGKMLGFTREEIEQAYFDKNKVNHERQQNGY